jgi:hypothetical protein
MIGLPAELDHILVPVIHAVRVIDEAHVAGGAELQDEAMRPVGRAEIDVEDLPYLPAEPAIGAGRTGWPVQPFDGDLLGDANFTAGRHQPNNSGTRWRSAAFSASRRAHRLRYQPMRAATW